ANNKSKNLEENLPAILTQNHPKFEVIVVNDGSEDGSDDLLNILRKQYSNLEVRNLVTNNLLHGKALALGVGIKAARYEKIVLCEVDCIPYSSNWLSSLSQGFSEGRQIVNAYTGLDAKKFVRADAFFEALNLMGSALNGRPYSTRGSNMAFDKELFFGRKGFDPMLKKYDKAEAVFFNAVARADNTSTITATEAVNRSAHSISFGNWRREKSRYLHSQRLFRQGTRNTGLFEIISRLLLFISIPVSIYFVLDEIWFTVAIGTLVVLRQTLQLIIFHRAQRQFNERGLLLYSFWWDIISIPAHLAVLLSFKQRRTFE
ncbi:MAG: glycosyltransferase, partial [Prevotellaceae bacterium]|nr:glycosyltransferase [Prevotellaceae bacterium]